MCAGDALLLRAVFLRSIFAAKIATLIAAKGLLCHRRCNINCGAGTRSWAVCGAATDVFVPGC